MSRIKLALAVVEDLKQLAESLEALVKTLDTDVKVSAGTEELKKEAIPIEKVRAVLAEKAQAGKQPEVKALITKYGAKKLTDIDPTLYKELLAEAEGL